MAEPLVLLPGFDGTGELFAAFQSTIDHRHRLIVASYRDENDLDAYVENVVGRLPAEPCVLVAESFSGPIAMAVMNQYPNRIKKAVLCATFLVSPFRLLTLIGSRMPGRLLKTGLLTRVVLNSLCLNGAPKALVEEAFDVVARIPPTTIRNRLRMLSSINMRGIASTIRTPTLLLQPTRDRLVSRSNYRSVIQELPRATVQMVEGPHLLLQAKPNQCWYAIRDFIAGESIIE